MTPDPRSSRTRRPHAARAAREDCGRRGPGTSGIARTAALAGLGAAIGCALAYAILGPAVLDSLRELASAIADASLQRPPSLGGR